VEWTDRHRCHLARPSQRHALCNRPGNCLSPILGRTTAGAL
jgi:hypothetical protein